MAKINGIVLLHKRYADWSGKTLQAGELGLNLSNYEVRIGTADGQSWENASVVSCKVEIQGTGKHIVDASYNNGKLILTKGTLSYNDLADLPELEFDAEGTAAAAVNAHNSAEDAHADIRKGVSDNASAINAEKQRAEGKEGELATAISNEEARAKKAEEDLQAAVNGKVAQEAYNTKVAALEQADKDLDAAVKAEATTRGQEITRVEGLISTEKDRVDTLVNTTVPGINAKIKANEDAIKALEGLTSSGLSRQVVTELPSVESALENVIYMIRRTDNVGAENKDIYDEYLLMGEGEDKRFELLGNTAVDLTDYYVKSEVYTKGEVDAAIDADVLVVSNALNKEVTDRENAVKEVADELAELKGENGYKKEIADAVKEEKDRAEEVEADFEERIADLEELGLQSAETYATKVELQGVSKAVSDEASRAAGEEARIEGLVNGLTTRMGTAEGKITTLEGQAAAVAGQIEAAVNTEKTAREQADTALDNRIKTLEGIKHTGKTPISVSEKYEISHNESGVAEQSKFGFFAFKVDKFGHITGVEAITTLDGNAE
jgi:chromosome segregation ATPase